jgi:ribose 5-phosphate isomerase B
MSVPIAIGCDDAGLALKRRVVEALTASGYSFADYGCAPDEGTDYPDVALRVAEAIARGEHERGILICGTGIGMAIVANKVPGVYAAQVHDPYSAERARKSNDAQIMTMGARVIGPELAESLVRTWLASEFEGGRSVAKLAKVAAVDRKSADA